MTYTEQAYSLAIFALKAFERSMVDLQWVQADVDEHARLTARLAIIGAFYKVTK